MSNKTPPLVIPVVVDTTGVSKGLNNVNDRLRRGVRGGGSGDGGFGSGGGMGAEALALAGGVGIAATAGRGAATAARSFSSMNPHFGSKVKARLDELQRRNASAASTFGGRRISSVADVFSRWADGNALDQYRHEGTLRAGGYSPKEWMWRAHPDRAFSESKKEMWQKRSTKVRGWADKYSRAALETKLGSLAPYLGDIGVGSIGAGVGGIGGFAAARTAISFTRNFSSNINQHDNLRGSKMWGRQRQAALRDYSSGPKPTVFQAFVGGSLLASGGKKTLLESHTETTNRQVNTTISALGAFYEGAGGFTPAQWLVKAILGRTHSN